MSKRIHTIAGILTLATIGFIGATCVSVAPARAALLPSFDEFLAKPPLHQLSKTTDGPAGLYPAEVKRAYHIPTTGGVGAIAIVTAFHHPHIESDLAAFDAAFKISACSIKNSCLEVHALGSTTKTDDGWSTETALDTQWAHAMAPGAKILVVEAASDRGSDLMKAIDYARNRTDVVSISMSWGGDEFAGETKLDGHFLTASSSARKATIAFFASSGDDGAGPSWPAVSSNVIAVGGTSLILDAKGTFASERAWSGSGGGASAYEPEEQYESTYNIPRSNGRRAIPDVSYAADPAYGFSVYHVSDSIPISPSNAASSSRGAWRVIGGTSAGAPQWAAIAALGISANKPISRTQLYRDKATSTYASYFRDITSGSNGTCSYYCSARKHYDYVTGLGSPVTYKF